ncbi:MAG: glycoside hydrolase family 88 protein [Bacteroidales bacterium]
MRLNKMKTVFAAGCLLVFSSCCSTKETKQEAWSVRMAESEMVRFPEPWMIEKAKVPRWGYTHGLVVKGMLEQWKHTGDSVYFNYARIYADSLINAKGAIKTYKFNSFNIDNINPGKILFDLYEQTGQANYKAAMDTLYNQMQVHPRTSEGGFWHKLKYEHQMWLDGLYMASPFLAQYGQTFGKPELFTEAVSQIKLIARHTYDEKSGLFYHGWDESGNQKWADKVTGCSPNFWSRSIGWYAASLVDVLDFLPKDTAGRDSVIQIVQTLADGILRYQDSESGVWYQVTDQGAREGNYKESSATALFVYFLSKSINNGYLPASYREATEKAFAGLTREFIREEANGTITVTNCCAVAGLGGDKNYRDGSFEYYINEPVIENDPKSTGSFILAAIEYEKMVNNKK